MNISEIPDSTGKNMSNDCIFCIGSGERKGEICTHCGGTGEGEECQFGKGNDCCDCPKCMAEMDPLQENETGG